MEKKYSLEEALKEYKLAFNKYLEADARVVAALEAYDKAQKEKARAMIRGAIYAAVGFLVGSILSKIIF